MRTISLIIMCVCLVGCSTVQRPTVQVADVRITQTSDEGAALAVTVDLQNPNGVALPLKKSRYAIRMAGGPSFVTTIRALQTIPANGRQIVVLTAALPGNITNQKFNVTGSFTYEPPGKLRKILTDSYVPLPSVSFSKSGRLN